MSASDQDLAGLPDDVREAAVRWDDVAERFGPESSGSRDWATIRAELLRLDRECQDRIRQALENGQRAERAEAELAAVTKELDIYRSEAELIMREDGGRTANKFGAMLVARVEMRIAQENSNGK